MSLVVLSVAVLSRENPHLARVVATHEVVVFVGHSVDEVQLWVGPFCHACSRLHILEGGEQA